MKTSNIQVRVPAELRKKTDRVLSGVGMDLSTAVRIFMNQVVYSGGIPFEVKLPEKNADVERFEIIEVTPEIQSKMDKVGLALGKALKSQRVK